MRVEARLTESDPAKLRIGMAMELTLIPEATVRVQAGHERRHRDHRHRHPPVRPPPGRLRPGDGRARRPRRARPTPASAGSEIDFAAGGSDAAGNADTTVSVLGLTGVPFINVKNGCATGGSALITAHAMLAAGSAETALVVGFDKHPPGAFNPLPEEWGIGSWYGETGLMLTTQFFAMKIQRYMAEHGDQRVDAGQGREQGVRRTAR